MDAYLIIRLAQPDAMSCLRRLSYHNDAQPDAGEAARSDRCPVSNVLTDVGSAAITAHKPRIPSLMAVFAAQTEANPFFKTKNCRYSKDKRGGGFIYYLYK